MVSKYACQLPCPQTAATKLLTTTAALLMLAASWTLTHKGRQHAGIQVPHGYLMRAAPGSGRPEDDAEPLHLCRREHNVALAARQLKCVARRHAHAHSGRQQAGVAQAPLQTGCGTLLSKLRWEEGCRKHMRVCMLPWLQVLCTTQRIGGLA